jgi:hypothetical protein
LERICITKESTPSSCCTIGYLRATFIVNKNDSRKKFTLFENFIDNPYVTNCLYIF